MKNVMQEKLEVKKCVSSELYTGSNRTQDYFESPLKKKDYLI